MLRVTILQKIPQKGTIIIKVKAGDGVTVVEASIIAMAIVNILNIMVRVLTDVEVAQTAGEEVKARYIPTIDAEKRFI